MFRLIPRMLLRPTTLAVLAIAAAWGLWWLWPERPISVLRIKDRDRVSDAVFSPDGRYLHIGLIDYDDERPRTARWRLLRSCDGVNVIPESQVLGSARFLENDCALLRDYGAAKLVHLPTEEIR